MITFIAAAMFAALGTFAGSPAWDTVVTYPATAFAEPSSDFTMTVDGQPVFVEENRHISFAHFSFSGTATLVITYAHPIRSYELAPLSYGIHPAVSGNTMTFSLSIPRKLVLHHLNNAHPSRITEPRLLIFADPLEDDPPSAHGRGIINVVDRGIDNSGKTDVTRALQRLIEEAAQTRSTLYFPAGTYTVVTLATVSNLTMYLAGGARLHTSDKRDASALTLLAFDNVHNVRLYGRGSLDGNGVYLRYGRGGPHELRDIVRSEVADTCSIDGLELIDPSEFNVFVRRSQNWLLTDLKLIDFENADLAPYAGVDGIDPDQSRGVWLDDSFILSGDDTTSVKAADTVRFRTIGMLAYKNSVFYNTGSGSSMDNSDIDTPVTLRDVSWENVDVVESLFGATFFGNRTGAELQDEFVKNVRQGPVFASLIEIESGPANVRNIILDQLAGVTYGPNGRGGKYGNFIRGKSNSQTVRGVTFNDFTVAGKLQRSASEIQTNAYVHGLVFGDSDTPVVEIAASADHAQRKPLKTATITIARAGDRSKALSVPLIIGGSALNGVDYKQIPSSVTIPAGRTSVSETIVPLQGEGLKTVRVEPGSQPFGLAYTLGPDYEAVVTIVD